MQQLSLYDSIQETAAYLKGKIKAQPTIGVVLGSGLGDLTHMMDIDVEVPYEDIPHFPVTTVKGHGCKLVFGKINDKQVVLMAGRFHYYEGNTMQEVTFPVRVMKALGVGVLMLSNAAGGMNPQFKVGDLMIIKDHINQFPEHPLRGPNDERLGTRFPDMSQPYDLQLIAKAQSIAAAQGTLTHTGTYVGLQGPTFETPAEYKWLRIIGGDTVGMSTVPEAIVAIHGGMRVFAVSVVTDLGVEGHVETITHEEVLAAANAAAPKLSALFAELIKQL